MTVRRVLLALLLITPTLVAQRGYYREPAIHGDTIVFVSEGDLWRVGATGGVASRLTTHHSEERTPAISPDGKMVAFVGRYDGAAEVYTMPLEGGLPTRRTFGAGRGVHVAGFTPDGKLLYASGRRATLPALQLYALDLSTNAATRFPLAEAWQGAMTTDGKTLVFTRFRHTQHCKRYRGGTAEQLWRFALPGGVGAEAQPLAADHPGTSRHPMIHEGRVYHVTDRDGHLNLWSMALDGTDRRQHTKFVGWDVMEASLGGGRIVYRIGADLGIFDLASGKHETLDIRLRSDRDQTRERWIEEPMSRLDAAHLSPDGKHVALTARGQAFVAPVKDETGGVITLSRKGDVRYRTARFLPESDRVLAWSDESGEIELWSLQPDGRRARKQITKGGAIERRDFVPSPDGKFVAWTDKNAALWLLDLKTERARQIDRGERGFGGITWSADGRWLTASRPEPNGFSVIRLYEAASDRALTITSDRYNSFDPALTPDGKWLYFLSDRHFTSRVGSPWGAHQPAPYFQNKTGIYAVALADGLRFPFDPGTDKKTDDDKKGDKTDKKTKSDDSDASKAKDGEAGRGAKKKRKKKKAKPVPFPTRVHALYRVPVSPSAYRGLLATSRSLLFSDRGSSTRGGGRRGGGRALKALAMAYDATAKTMLDGVRSWSRSADGKKLLVRKGSALYVVGTKAKGKLEGKALSKAKVDLSGWRLRLDPREEWRQIFDDAWRMHRDYFYDAKMHGVDWPRMRAKYRPLVNRVGSREELNDVIGQMIAELSALHSRASGGDRRFGTESIAGGSLGAHITADASKSMWRIDHIYRGDPERPDRRGPLARPDLGLKTGDGILAVNGIPFQPGLSLDAMLREKVGEHVRLRLTAAGRDPFDAAVQVISLSREADLRYDEWEWRAKSRTDARTRDRVGYVHLRAMGSRDIGTWFREYSPLINKQALIIDVRGNRGGNIDSWILNRLVRRAWFYWQRRTGRPTWNMHRAFRGHMVVLCDHRTASDGEAFAEGFKRLGLGKVIGTRTWGGEIWLSRGNRQVDRGVASAGEIGVYAADGTWLIEGHGVEPDIVVDNLPHATFRGDDRQLDAAIDHVLKLISDDPRPVPNPPTYPDKSSPDNRVNAAGGDR